MKKNQSAPRPSEHPPVMGEKMSKRLGGIKGCKYKTSSWHLNRFPMQITLGQQYNVGEKPTVILYIYINHIQRIGCQPEKTTLHGGQSRSWSAEQGTCRIGNLTRLILPLATVYVMTIHT